MLIFLSSIDAETHYPEPILQEETHEVEEEAGSFSPELLHGDENDEAIDAEEDRAILVTQYLYCPLMSMLTKEYLWLTMFLVNRKGNVLC